MVTTDADDRESNQFDLRSDNSDGSAATTPRILVAGTRFSKSFGSIGSRERSEPRVQRIRSVGPANSAAILASIALSPGSETVVTSGFTGPDAFRVLSVQGNQAGVTGSVRIVGTDWASNPITDTLALNGTTLVEGLKPFRSVSKVVAPPGASGQTVSVGTTNKLGFASPVSQASDVLLAARSSSATSAAFSSFAVGAVDTAYNTVVVDFATLVPPLDFEFSYRTTQ